MHTGGRLRKKKKAGKLWVSKETNPCAFELDELFWFTSSRRGQEKGINLYIMTMVSRFPRQIVSFQAGRSIKAQSIQNIVDAAPDAENYFTDGGTVYLDVDFIGKHRRNIRDKSDTYTVEGTNADLRHYIAGLRRRSRCFFRKLETLKAVLTIFINAYNKFGQAKENYYKRHPHAGRDFSFSHLQFV